MASPSAVPGIRPGSAAAASGPARPRVEGKFLWLGEEKLWVRGVTYGTFPSGGPDEGYPEPSVVEGDFAQMRANGINTVRIYTVPPPWLLDLASCQGLFVMVGLPWEQHVAFLEDRSRARDIERRVREGVRACAGHPSVLCYAVGNEIPAPIVRWHGRRRIEHYLRRLCEAVKGEDPGALVTYVNYPSTEFLELSFADIACFNVYLEQRESLEAYLARLHNVVGDRPLLLAEVGLDSRRNGEEEQAQSLAWQIESAFASGCAGAFVFAWTDEWHRGGHDIEDWDFGLTDRGRRAKPALARVRDAFADGPFAGSLAWPRISVVVCTHNGGSTLPDCLAGLERLDYPDYEVIVVDDGSTDHSAAVAAKDGVKLIKTRNRGLSSARNTGLGAATGEIVAYIDDDAQPDPHWLRYLGATFLRSHHAAVGGPNVAPPQGGVADCVASAPGGPIHVLVSDSEAEHIPGCNMAVRRDVLDAIGGFDERFRVAGDDVDVCWRLREQGKSIGFHPGAMVWHRRRDSIRAYWRQQRGYGEAEADLERKWPQKYNSAGHPTWAGRVYGPGGARQLIPRSGRIRYGTWGTALFQSIYAPPTSNVASFPLMPEWYLLVGGLTAVAALGAVWAPLLVALPLLALALGVSLAQAAIGAARNAPSPTGITRPRRLQLLAITALLHLIQPLARLRGRLRRGLHPLRWGLDRALVLPWPRTLLVWSESPRSIEAWLLAVEELLGSRGMPPRRGGEFDRWEFELRVGIFGAARVLAAVEDHHAGRQLVRWRLWPRPSVTFSLLGVLAVLLATAAGFSDAIPAAAILAAAGALLLGRVALETAAATADVAGAIDELGRAAAEAPGTTVRLDPEVEEGPTERRAA
jgi:O-antigen biosynthesis protein